MVVRLPTAFRRSFSEFRCKVTKNISYSPHFPTKNFSVIFSTSYQKSYQQPKSQIIIVLYYLFDLVGKSGAIFNLSPCPRLSPRLSPRPLPASPCLYTFHLTSYTLHLTPYTLHLYTLHPTPYTLHPTPSYLSTNS